MTHDNDNNGVARSSEEIGQQLREGRRKKSLTLEEASAQLRLPYSTLEALEAGRQADLGPPVYVRGYLQNYARLLGLDLHLPDSPETRPEPEELEPPVMNLRPSVGRGRRLVDQYAKLASYLVATVVVALPVLWWGGTGILDSIGIGEKPVSDAVDAIPSTPTSAANGTNSTQVAADDKVEPQGPMVASMTPRRSASVNVPDSVMSPLESTNSMSEPSLAASERAADQEGEALTREGMVDIELQLSGDSWVEILDSDGTRLEYNLLNQDSVHRYTASPPLRMLIGNAAAVEIRIDGLPFDTRPHRQGNMARFEIGEQIVAKLRSEVQ